MSFSGVATKMGDGATMPLPPAGNHPAVLVAMVDLGTQTETKFGDRSQTKDIHKVYLVWELVAEQIEGTKDNYVIGNKYTVAFVESSNLRQIAETLRGDKYKDGDPIDYGKMLGSKCLLQVIHGTAKNSGRPYARVDGCSQLPKGMTISSPQHKPFLFDLATGAPDQLPSWLPWIIGESVVDVVKRSKEVKGRNSAVAMAEAEDSPF